MAATQAYGVMAPFSHNNDNNQCIDPSEMDSWVDFSAMPSPTPKQQPVSPSSMNSPVLALDQGEESQQPQKPSHEYDRFKQQTGLPTGSMATLNSIHNQAYTHMSNTLESIEDYGYYGSQSGLGGMGSDIGMDMDPTSPMPGYFYPPGNGPNNDFVNPTQLESNSEERSGQTMRAWPGMHQQQALAKAQAQAQQQRQQQMMQQRQQQKQQASQQQVHKRTASHLTDARTEETIARVVNQIRQNSQVSGRSMSPQGLLPHVVRMKKDEEDMDEDERLLASEEGKKLSSKERRQLRNKVSARAFRSRRKEYIGQLEGEIAMKSNEVTELTLENQALMAENARSRAFIEKLLRHPAFHPFLDELSQDPALHESLSKMGAPQPQQQQHQQQQQHAPKDVNSYHAQQYLESQRHDNMHVGMATVPEQHLDMSALSINNNNNWNVSPMGFQYQPQVFAVLEVPQGPEDPLDVETMMGKTETALPELPSIEEDKVEYPVIETPATVEAEESTGSSAAPITDDDPMFALYAEAPATPVATTASSDDYEPLVGDVAPEKVFSHFELFVSSEEDNERSMQRFAKLTARAEKSLARLQALTSMLDEE